MDKKKILDEKKYLINKFSEYFIIGANKLFSDYPIGLNGTASNDVESDLKNAEQQFNIFFDLLASSLKQRRDSITYLSKLISALENIKSCRPENINSYIENFVLPPLYSYINETRLLVKTCNAIKNREKIFKEILIFPYITLNRINCFYKIIDEKNGANIMEEFLEELAKSNIEKARVVFDKLLSNLKKTFPSVKI